LYDRIISLRGEVCAYKTSLTSPFVTDVSAPSQEEEFEDTKGVIKIRIPKKNRQHNGQKQKYKRTNNDQQNIHIKLKIE
jgi:tRNA A-37 threonylcarbamoyl transferase component Bud32